MLFQLEDDSRNVISYASAKFSFTEKRYSKLEQECHAVEWSLKHFRPQSEAAPFHLHTDEKALKWLKNSKENTPKFGRWARFLDEFRFTVHFRSNTGHELTTALAQNPRDSPTESEEDNLLFPPEIAPQFDAPFLAQITTNNFFEEVIAPQQEDKTIIKHVQR